MLRLEPTTHIEDGGNGKEQELLAALPNDVKSQLKALDTAKFAAYG